VLARSLLFNVVLFLSVALWSIVVVVGRLWGYAVAYDLTVSWSRWILGVCEKICGLRYVVEGMENLPAGNSVVLLKHSSAYETIAQMGAVPAADLGAQERNPVDALSGLGCCRGKADCHQPAGGQAGCRPGHCPGTPAPERRPVGDDFSGGHADATGTNPQIRCEWCASRHRGRQTAGTGGTQRRRLLAPTRLAQAAGHGDFPYRQSC
jgi:hypothetical protein